MTKVRIKKEPSKNYYLQVEPFPNNDFVTCAGGSFAYIENDYFHAYRVASRSFDSGSLNRRYIFNGYLHSSRSKYTQRIVKEFESLEELKDEIEKHLVMEELCEK